MEVVGSDGSKTQIKLGQTRELGRAHGLSSSDKIISRRQISFFIPLLTHNQEVRLQFEILGKNPVYVYKDNEVKLFRRFERSEMGNGDMFCVSAKNPVWYTLRKIETDGESVRQNDLESELAGNLESGFGFKGVEDLQLEGVDLSDIDPIKEFGFVVMGHEFDSYPKKMIPDIKNWDWFLEEDGKDSEDDEEDKGKKGRGSGRRKRKKGIENDDDEWTGESEDDKVLINKLRKDQRSQYKTRSKDSGKPNKDTSESRGTKRTKNRDVDDEEEEENEDDETLGGFIVDNENLEDEEVIDDEEEEEEEFVDEHDEDEDE